MKRTMINLIAAATMTLGCVTGVEPDSRGDSGARGLALFLEGEYGKAAGQFRRAADLAAVTPARERLLREAECRSLMLAGAAGLERCVARLEGLASASGTVSRTTKTTLLLGKIAVGASLGGARPHAGLQPLLEAAAQEVSK